MDVVPQKNGSDVEVGSLLLEAAAWVIVTFREGKRLTVNLRRRQMTPIGEDTHGDSEKVEESERDGVAEIDKTYRVEDIFTLLALPQNGGDFTLVDTWPAEAGRKTGGFIELISYYDVGQKGTGLDSADPAEYKAAAMRSSPFLLMLPTLVAHKPHPGLVTAATAPSGAGTKTCPPPHQKLDVTRTSFQGFTLGAYDPSAPRQASIADWKTHGLELAYAHDHADTREYSFAENRKCMVLRKAPVDAAPRHLLMASPDEARRHAQAILALQKKADEAGAMVGGYGCRIKNMVLNVTDRATGDAISALCQSNARLKAYNEKMPNNGVFSALAK